MKLPDLAILNDSSPEISRREAIGLIAKTLAGVTIVGFVAPIFSACASSTAPNDSTNSTTIPETLKVSVATLDADNKAIRTTGPRQEPIFVIRRHPGAFVAILLVCTHNQCSGNNIEQRSDRLHCNCHGSEYDFDGHVIHGPAPQDLKTYTTTYDAATETVTIAIA